MRPYFKDSIELYKHQTKNINGHIITGIPELEYITLMCDIQPVNREQIYNTYGYYIDCQYCIYVDNYDIYNYSLSENCIIKHNENFYSIVKLIKWNKHTELFVIPYETE